MLEYDIPTSLTVVTPPETSALDLSDLKKRLRWTHTDSEDDIIEGWVRSASAYFEEQTARPPIVTGFEYWLAGFPTVIELPRTPVQEVSSVKYVGSDGTLVTLSTDVYELVAPQGDYCRRGWIQLKVGQSWPTVVARHGAVRVAFAAGYGDEPSEVPEQVKTTIQLLVGQYHKYRADTIETRQTQALTVLPRGVDQFIDQFKTTALPTKPPKWGAALWV